MKSIVIIVVLAVVLGVIGYFVGDKMAPNVENAVLAPTTRTSATKPSVSENNTQTADEAAALKRQYGMIYGGAGAGVGVIAGILLTWGMGKKKPAP
jgi:hypothetical protein